jgi:TrwC relaxase/Nuclease-related domain
VTPLRVGQEAYWLEQIARDRCEYYSGKGESSGWWRDGLAERSGLQGEASEEAVHRLFAGQDPVTGEQRVAPVWRADPRSKLPADPLQADHLVVGPTGVYVIDSKRYRGRLRYFAGHLWHGGRTLDRTLAALVWEATQVAETLGFGPDLHVYPVLCVHLARWPWRGELLVDGIPILDAAALRSACRSPARHSHLSRSPWSPARFAPASARRLIWRSMRCRVSRGPGRRRSGEHSLGRRVGQASRGHLRRHKASASVLWCAIIAITLIRWGLATPRNMDHGGTIS